MDTLKLRQEAERRFEAMLEDRQEYEPWWRELRDQFAPSRGRFNVYEKPKKGLVRRNSRARQMPDDFAAGIKSGLTSPSRPWFTLTLYNTRLAEMENVKRWLSEVQRIMQAQMIRTNLYDQLFDVYKEQGIFGTGALWVEEDDEDVFRAQSLTIGSYCIGVDKNGKVCRFGRTFRRTARQLASEFGEERLPQQIRLALRERGAGIENQRYELRNLVEPSDEFMREDGPGGNFRYRSLWWLAGFNEPEFLRRKGYHEMPVMVPRWRVIGDDVWGREQPGDVALDDAKAIQDLEVDERSAIKRKARPALLVPENLLRGELKDVPGGQTLYTPMGGNAPAITPLYAVDFDHQSAANKRLELTQHMEEAFYVNFFRMWTTDQRMGRTATEIEARESEKMYMLGPLIERQMSEMLDPLIARIFGIMERARMFPLPPEEIQGQDFKIEYVSVLASVQKQAAQAGIQIAMQTVGELAKMQMETQQSAPVLDKLDCDEIVDQIADMYALPAGIVLGDDAVEEKRREREEAQAQARQQAQMMAEAQAMAEAAPQVAGAAKDMSQTPMPDGGNALEAMAGIMGGGEM